MARIAYADSLVEKRSLAQAWGRTAEGEPLRLGDRIRTGPEATARIDFPWASLTLAAGTELQIAPSRVLAVVLEQGRLEQTSTSGDAIKLLTREAVVRGRGRVVLRRQGSRTLVSALEGTFRVEAAGRTVSLATGFGTSVEAGSTRTEPVRLARAPERLEPGSDPQYAAKDELVVLRFVSPARSHHLQLLAAGSDELLVARDIQDSPAALTIPWLGTFRWRVSTRDARGLEGPPSDEEGVITVVSK